MVRSAYAAAPAVPGPAATSRSKRHLVGDWADREDCAKEAVNRWLAELVAATSGPAEAPPWSLLLETRRLRTLGALRSALPRASAAATAVPNPSGEECAAMRAAAPGLLAFQATSHALLAALAGSGAAGGAPSAEERALRAAGWPGRFDFVWLDYCGTLSSEAGRQRQMDLRRLLAARLLAPAAVLAVTLAERGAPVAYAGEVVDGLVVLVLHAAEAAGLRLEVGGVCSWCRRTAPLHTVAFVPPGSALVPEPAAPGLEFAREWRVGGGLAMGMHSPLGVAVQCTAEAFARAASACRSALVVEGKLLAVTRALEAFGVEVTTVANDPLDAVLANWIHQRHKNGPSQGSIFFDLCSIQPPALAFEAAWFGYEASRPSTATQLQRADAWPDLNRVLSLRLLAPQATVAVCLGVTSTCEPWEGAALDWVLSGCREAMVRHGYGVVAAGAIRYATNTPQVTLFLRLGDGPCLDRQGGRDAELGHIPALQPLEVASDPPRIAGWECSSAWDEAREKRPTPGLQKLRALAPPIAAAARALGVSSALLHEPGFFFVLPQLRRAVPRTVCCARGDAVVQAELGRRALRVESPGGRELGAPFEGPSGDGGEALVLLEEGGPAFWRERWAERAKAWLGRRAARKLLAVVFEASDISAPRAMLSEFRAAAGAVFRVDTAVTFLHGGRRWAFLLIVSGSAEAAERHAAWASSHPRPVLPGKPAAIPGANDFDDCA